MKRAIARHRDRSGPDVARAPDLHRGARSLAAPAVYCAVSFAYFGLPLLIESGRQYIGGFNDPQILIWSFAWWPHAVLHGQNPFVTHVLWPPNGVNLAWANAVPGLSLLFAPLTLVLGPVTSYNVATVLIPALSAWAAFLLCRYITRAFWPSLVGGYLFGFSSYILGHEGVQLQLAAIFPMPLIALIVLRYLDGDVDGRTLSLCLGTLLGFEILTSTELAFTMTLALAGALLLGYALARDRRSRIRSALKPLVGGYAFAALLTSPFLYYALSNPRLSAFNPPNKYQADLLNLIIPTHVEAVGASWAQSIADHFPGNYAEQGGFLGPPALVIIGLFAWRRWRTAGGRFLLIGLVVTTFAALGTELTVDGHALLPLPTILGHDAVTLPLLGHHLIPLFNNILPIRIMLYASLAGAVIVALWMKSAPRSGALRWWLPALAVLVLVPNLGAGIWKTTFEIPPFFTDKAYRTCLGPDEVVLPEPVGAGGESLLWQVADDFRFNMSGGRVQMSPPSPFMHPSTIAQISVGYPPVPNQPALFAAYFRSKGVTSVIVDKERGAMWLPALDKLAKRHDVGGVVLYHVAGLAPVCPAAG